MKRIRFTIGGATCTSGTMPEPLAVRLCGILALPMLANVCIIDA